MSEPTTVCVIHNDAQTRQNLAAILEFIGYDSVVTTDSQQWGENKEKSGAQEIVLLGECGSQEKLLEVFNKISTQNKQKPVLLLTDKHRKPKVPAELITGSFRLVDLPLKYTQLTDALHQAQVFNLSKKDKSGAQSLELFRSLVGNSRSVRRVRQLMEQVADSEATVLILGESGTGKEVVARNLHYHSHRREQPFVPINCGAIPPDLLESELFGHEKGAFTGAISMRQGRFELAKGGTLFLDEIGDMSMAMQVKLLRVLQEKTFERIGSNKSITADVRIVAATHRDLELLIKENKFREDLYYRLNVFPISMPPLCERVDDIPLLVNELIARLEHEKRGSIRFSPAAMMLICQHRWPGNVRELSNLIERLSIIHPYGVIDVSDLPEKFQMLGENESKPVKFEQNLAPVEIENSPRLPREGIDLKEHLNHLEFFLIKQALDEAGGVVAHAAKRLHMRRTTLVEKLRKHGLQRSESVAGI